MVGGILKGCPKRLREPPASPRAPTLGFCPLKLLEWMGPPTPSRVWGCMWNKQVFPSVLYVFIKLAMRAPARHRGGVPGLVLDQPHLPPSCCLEMSFCSWVIWDLVILNLLGCGLQELVQT